MQKEVLVKIIGSQVGEQVDGTPIEVFSVGEYYHKGESHYILFEEILEGTDGITKSTVKFDEAEMLLKRTGATNVQLNFCRDHKTVSNYRTGYGNLVMGITTNGYFMEESEEKISLRVEYGLDVNYEFLADCTLCVEITPKDKGLDLKQGLI